MACMAEITALGGGAPPVATSTVWLNLILTSSGAWISAPRTIGAPHRWVTPCASIIRKISPGSIWRRQTWVPAAAVTAHV